MTTMNPTPPPPPAPHDDDRGIGVAAHAGIPVAAHAPAQPSPEHGHGRHASAIDEHDLPKDLPKPHSATVAILAVVFFALLAGIFVVGYLPHRHEQEQTKSDAKEQASGAPIVDVTVPKAAASTNDLFFPCDVRAWQDTSIFPRANGYLKKLYVDIQDHVEAGQLLAEIDTPEVDAQLGQSNAQLEVAKANVTRAQADLDLAQKTLQRFEEAAKNQPGSVTQQDLDTHRSQYDQSAAALVQAKANVLAAQSDVQRLAVTQGFEKVTAPFSGTITARNYDVGALLSPTATTPGKELFRLAHTDTLRVFVSVPQSEATDIKVGQPAYLTVRNYRGREFTGTVARSSGAIDTATRTLSLELDFPNKDHALYAGMYGQARLNVTDNQPVLVIPSSALIFNATGLQVAVVRDGKAHYQKIRAGRDLGTELEVAEGLNPEDKVITNPGERLTEGGPVEVLKKNPPTATADAAPDKPQRPRTAAAN